MNQAKIRHMWEVLDKNRGKYPLEDLESHIDTLKQAGIDVGPEELEALLRRMGRMGELYFPVDLAHFIAEIIASRSPQSILDPWAGAGVLIGTLADKIQSAVLDAYNKNLQAHKLLQKIVFGANINPKHVDPLQELKNSKIEYDAVVSCPPFGWKSGDVISLDINGSLKDVKDDLGHLLILYSCLRLKDNGIGVFVIPQKFMVQEKPSGARKTLHDLGFQIRACIEVPSGSFLPITGIASSLIVIERGDPQSLFVAQYSPDTKHQETVLTNFLKGGEGKRVAQGKWVQMDEFRGFQVLDAQERIYNLAKRMGLEETPFGSIVSEVNQTKSGPEFVRLPEKPNVVYLPLMATTQATTAQDELPEKLKSYIQIVIDDDVAEAGFVARLLNTELGQEIRNTARRGITIPRIQHRDLLDAPMFLPPLEIQRQVMQTQTNISRLRNEIEELESQLWRYPRSVNKVKSGIQSLNKEERFVDWIETLPFPLASSLWRFHAYKGTARESFERLLAFFEALVEFCALVHLSALKSNEALWIQFRDELNSRLEKENLSLELASFGAWRICAEFLSSKVRKLREDEKTREMCFEIYRTHDQSVLDAITSKRIVGVLQTTNAIRNSYHGHVGAVSDSLAERIREKLMVQLERVREVYGDAWQSYELLRPLKCRHRDGVIYFEAQRIIGTRSMPFETTKVELVEAMEDEQLHLWSPGENRVLTLLPLIKVLPSPKTAQNACYFYNRRQPDGIRFLSYHFEDDAEIVKSFKDVDQVLKNLFGEGAS